MIGNMRGRGRSKPDTESGGKSALSKAAQTRETEEL